MFRRGLKNNIKDKLIRYRESTDTLLELIEVAIKINNKLY